MPIDSHPQPCPHCRRPTVLMSYHWGRQWVHVGTWRPRCGAPTWARRAATRTDGRVTPHAA
ncbi:MULTISPECIES: hypothetical protein [Prauserella]|uniref:Uncharacterized protein n=1 Tax=Prauserella endophytica TaxID=1592324 RepID=A0ABY2S8G2_9PSEU|nr:MULTISPECIES: hypothetical protein [Prauserella]TKG72188.1 hypothetical protein FCN18_07975 [Prauserella endophytica]